MGLRKKLQEETVKRLPIREAISVSPDTKLRDAVAKMRGKQLGCAVIAKADGTPIAFFTERSLLDAISQGVSLDDAVVKDHAEKLFPQCKQSDPVSKVWDLILSEKCRFVLVTSDDGKVLGLTGQRGLAEYVSEYYPQQVMVQRLGAKPVMQEREGA